MNLQTLKTRALFARVIVDLIEPIENCANMLQKQVDDASARPPRVGVTASRIEMLKNWSASAFKQVEEYDDGTVAKALRELEWFAEEAAEGVEFDDGYGKRRPSDHIPEDQLSTIEEAANVARTFARTFREQFPIESGISPVRHRNSLGARFMRW